MKKIVIIIVILSGILLFNLLDLQTYLNMEQLIEQKNDLLSYVENHYILSYLSYILVYILVVTFSLPGAAVSSIAGGLLFGLLPGLIAVNIGATIGSTINFSMARYVIGTSLQEKYKDKFEKFNREIDKNGKSYLLTLRLIPIFPFFLINLLAGLTSVKMKTFIWTTAVGIIPGSIFYVYAGTTLKDANALGEVITLKTLIPLIILGLVAFLPVIYNKMKQGAHE